ncbi:MAG: hypothetical protein A2512_13240 [Deltaproteobacteria bacterium RIFOXYD12_FULL_56_24]|nr:MAG: hypothetical protein A2512_13240 [Deltaproteobacteria bacterium RIFOXYD12_FULL_56_24]
MQTYLFLISANFPKIPSPLRERVRERVDSAIYPLSPALSPSKAGERENFKGALSVQITSCGKFALIRHLLDPGP